MNEQHNTDLKILINDLSTPLAPQPTGAEPVLPVCGNIRAVLFDVYGTLLISGSGDIGSAKKSARAAHLHEALRRTGLEPDAKAAEKGIRLMLDLIEKKHVEKREQGTDWPEIDVRNIWANVLAQLAADKNIAGRPDSGGIARLAVEYECRANPAWPMPHAHEIIRELKKKHITLGIVSNAQFFTPLIIDALLGAPPSALGFSHKLCIWSWQLGIAKPSPALHRRAAGKLKKDHDIQPQHALYLGNDMLNDIVPAADAGFKTALFAGDQRSLKMRGTEPKCRETEPDAVITDLKQLGNLVKGLK